MVKKARALSGPCDLIVGAFRLRSFSRLVQVVLTLKPVQHDSRYELNIETALCHLRSTFFVVDLYEILEQYE
jgi:hypothetical protein